MRMTTKLRQKLRSGKTIWASGAYDALSAALIEEAGFDAILTSGFAISASHLGEPDVEIYTMTENLAVVRHAVNRTGIPVIADCDTGYGNAINVMRTVREFEQAGVAAMIFEDQVVPKRCPAIATVVEVLPLAESTAKIRAAVAARRDSDLVIVARTDAVDEGEAIRRAQAYEAAGADVIQPISRCFKSEAALRRLKAAVKVPLSLQILGWLEKDLTPQSIGEIAGIATFPLVPLMTVTDALRANLKILARDKGTKNLPFPQMSMEMFKAFIGYKKIEELQAQYLPGEAKAAE